MFQLLDCSPLPQFAVGLDNKITYWNKACEALTGFKAAEMIGTDRHWEPFYSHKRPIVADLILKNDLSSFFNLYQDKNPGQSKLIPNAWEAFDWFKMCGQALHLHFMAAPVFDEQGQLVGAVETLHDLSGRMLAMLAPAQLGTFPGNDKLKKADFFKNHLRFGLLVGNSPVMQRVYELLAKAAGSSANVIIYGESGTGKEVVARTIHDLSHRTGKNFVAVNCGAIPETLAESEFFGYRKGAFTGANSDREGYLDQADGGTLFLDEIGEISLAMQVKLLRVLEGNGFCPVGSRETRKPDVRIVGATSRNMEGLVRAGRIRRDFFYRIHVIPVQLPPLRDRGEDLRPLTDHFIRKFNPEAGTPRVPDEVYRSLEQYSWPGNVRELQNVIQRYLTLGELVFTPTGSGIQEAASVGVPDFASDQGFGPPPLSGLPSDGDHSTDPARSNLAAVAPGQIANSGNLQGNISTVERELILQALKTNQWHRQKTAGMLGISRKTLFRKMRQFAI